MKASVSTVVSLLVLGCSGVDTSLPLDGDLGVELEESENDIIRATANGGRNEAVMLYILYRNPENGEIWTRTCSGSYYAPRVVLTAAHCLENALRNGAWVYYGDNYAADLPAVTGNFGRLNVPPPGQPSTFAAVDSFEINPAWDPALVYADMGVVYLDRKLPFDPMPLARFNIGSSFKNKETTFSGWGLGVATGPVSGTGGQVQRTGKTKFLGSPTAADYHPDDPNPGMLDANVRKAVLKTDGRAPYSNGCFGDSGGPIFATQNGQTYIAGVSYWTGLYCEDYNLYTRIDPFLPFLDESYKNGGQDVLTPTFECVKNNGGGSYTAYFGYNNSNGVAVTVPYGNKNRLLLDSQNRRPTVFEPGVNPFRFGIDFTGNQTVTYTLSPENSPTTTLNVTKTSTACTSADLTELECAANCNAQEASGCALSSSIVECIDSCIEGTTSIPDCAAEFTAYNACYAATPPGEENWECFYGAAFAPCWEEETALIECFYSL